MMPGARTGGRTRRSIKTNPARPIDTYAVTIGPAHSHSQMGDPIVQ